MTKTKFQRRLWTAVAVIAAFIVGAATGAALFYGVQLLLSESEAPANEPTACPEPWVTVETGKLRGTCRQAHLDLPKYAAFLGVPYAQPPLGPLRFKSPRPALSWNGTRDAIYVGNTCRQEGIAQPGDEDCLYLNVYTTQLDSQVLQSMPVLVHVHGGGGTGTGNVIRPDYFVARGIVVVTFNYRLSVFGVLNTDSDLAPGNAGLKDMVAVLKWVNRNIRNFGGDPDQVTVYGCSSAGASVHWLSLLPETEGLFRAVVLKSGSALNSFGFTNQHRELAGGVVSRLRHWMPSLDDASLLESTPAGSLDVAYAFADQHRDKTTPEGTRTPYISVEKRPKGQENILIERDPESYVRMPARSAVPILVGITKCEFDMQATMLEMMDQLPPGFATAMVPPGVLPGEDTRKALGISTYNFTFDDAAADIRLQFFDVSLLDPACNTTLCRWQEYLSDALIKVDVVRTIRLHAQQGLAPVYAYFYEFPINGECPIHASDNRMTWPEDERELIQLNTTDPLAFNTLRQVTMMTNFVKFGKPVQQPDDVVLPSEWLAMENTGPDVFMRIGKSLQLEKGDLLGNFGLFWDSLYAKYRNQKTNIF